MNDLIFGKNDKTRIVSIEPNESTAEIFRELEDGSVVSEIVPNSRYILYSEQYSPKMKRLAGNQYYRYMIEYDSSERYQDVLSSSYKKRYPLHTIRDPKESIMVKDGYGYFKGMKVEDVSALSFDLETNGLAKDKDSKVLLISNTFRSKGKVERKLFSIDDYPNQTVMIDEWCKWVREIDPSIMVGHYLYGFDLPYLDFCCGGDGLKLGRDGSCLRFANKTSKFRKDMSQSYDFTNAYIYGREIVDTWFLSMKYDVATRREYESYKLKDIIRHEGLERKGRVLVDASKIKDYYANRLTNPKPWDDTKIYAVDDADDALKLYDLMIPSFFYYAQSIPRSFQQIINSATGSQINSLMVRSYLQQGHSIALGSEKEPFEGAIVFGLPGIHKNVFKIDVASLYPSIILAKRIYNAEKDPQELFLKIVDFFTKERLVNKELGQKTGNTYYIQLSDGQKIVINSMFGFLAAPKLNYNSPKHAALITKFGRELLQQAILWASGKEYIPILKDDGEDDNEAA